MSTGVSWVRELGRLLALEKRAGGVSGAGAASQPGLAQRLESALASGALNAWERANPIEAGWRAFYANPDLWKLLGQLAAGGAVGGAVLEWDRDHPVRSLARGGLYGAGLGALLWLLLGHGAALAAYRRHGKAIDRLARRALGR